VLKLDKLGFETDFAH